MYSIDITPDTKLPVCILDKTGRLHTTDAGKLSLEEAYQFASDLGLERVRICSGDTERRVGTQEWETEEYECWIVSISKQD